MKYTFYCVRMCKDPFSKEQLLITHFNCMTYTLCVSVCELILNNKHQRYKSKINIKQNLS